MEKQKGNEQRLLNDDEIAYMSNFEYELRYAMNDVLIGVLPETYSKFVKIYNRAFKANEKNTGCGSCKLRVIKKLANLYANEVHPLNK